MTRSVTPVPEYQLWSKTVCKRLCSHAILNFQESTWKSDLSGRSDLIA